MARQSRRERIKAVLRTQFGTMRAFEQSKGLAQNSVRDVLRGRASTHTEDAIAEAMEEPVHKLFPDRRHAVPEADDSSTKRDDTRSGGNAHRLSRGVV